MTLWAGIDCGYSHLTVAILNDAGRTLDVGDAHLPLGNGHERSVALVRFQCEYSTEVESVGCCSD